MAQEDLKGGLAMVLGGGPIPEVVGSADGLTPVPVRQVAVLEHGPHLLQEGPVEPLSHPIGLWGVGSGGLLENPLAAAVGGHGLVEVLPSSITPDGFDSPPQLGLQLLDHVLQSWPCPIFELEEGDPAVPGGIISHCGNVFLSCLGDHASGAEVHVQEVTRESGRP
jgi:hypothetical protein